MVETYKVEVIKTSFIELQLPNFGLMITTKM